jgi:hypothetical protein
VSDNVGVDNATLASYTVSSDEAASGQLQRVKLAYSADGVDTHVTADAQGLKVQGQVSLANSVVNVSQAGSYSVTQGTSPWVVNTGGSVSVSGTTLASIVGSINNNPLNVNASQAGSWTVTAGSGTNTLNVNVASHTDSHTFNYNIASQSLSAVTVDEGNTPFNVNLASQSLSAVTVSAGSNTLNVNVASHSDSHTFNFNLASQSLSAVTVDEGNYPVQHQHCFAESFRGHALYGDVNVNLASRTTSATENVSVVGSTFVNQGPSTWRGTFKSAAGSLGSFTQSAGAAGVKNYLEGFTYSWNASFISSNATTFQIKDGTVVIYEEAISGAGNAATVNGNKTVIFDAPLAGTAASTMTSQFSAVSAGSVEIVSMWGYTGA